MTVWPPAPPCEPPPRPSTRMTRSGSLLRSRLLPWKPARVFCATQTMSSAPPFRSPSSQLAAGTTISPRPPTLRCASCYGGLRTHLRKCRGGSMQRTVASTLAGTLRDAAPPLTGSKDDYAPLLELIGNAPVVLLGEASHGTHEFYRERARITRRLIDEKGFGAVAVEADWPDAFRVNRWVRVAGKDRTAFEALAGFERFPRWMWRNRDVLEFVDWLGGHNESLSRNERAGFYGLDLYSLYASMQEVVRFLEGIDPEAAKRARYRYSCFDAFGEDTQAYGYAAEFDLAQSCEDQAVQQLLELQRRAAELALRDGRIPDDEIFYAEQNARLVKNAEQYYRTMFQGRVSSWNLRDRHMTETLEALIAHLERTGRTAKIAVWEHNSH